MKGKNVHGVRMHMPIGTLHCAMLWPVSQTSSRLVIGDLLCEETGQNCGLDNTHSAILVAVFLQGQGQGLYCVYIFVSDNMAQDDRLCSRQDVCCGRLISIPHL